MKRLTFMSLVLLFVIAFSAAAALPVEKITLPQLKAEVSVRYDEFGVPHVKAANEYDLFFAQGYITAQDRLWQMDMNRREVNGKMAELRGKDYIGQDFDRYKVGLPQVSKKIWESADEKEKLIFGAYADGVNAYIAGLKVLPEEYVETGTKPELWRPVDSVAIGRGVSWVMSSSLGLEAAIGVLVKKLGKPMVMRLLPIEPIDPTRVVKDENFSSFPIERFDAAIASRFDSPLFRFGNLDFGSGMASNNWVVSSRKSASGYAMLSSDTHTGNPSPALWYEIQIESPVMNAMGVSYPGTPGVMVGHNGYISWGPTTAQYDVTDVYVEKPDPAKPETNYMYKDKSIPYEIETIDIKYAAPEGMKSETKTIKHTLHGPVIYEEAPSTVMSFRWTGAEPTHEGRAFYGFMTARNLDDFKKSLSSFESGGMNFVYADVDGNIYYRGQAKVPVRKGTAYLPLDGSTDEFEWTGYVPFDKLPHAENPADGFIATANNKQVGKNYPYYLSVIYDKGFRARRISDLLAAENKVTFEKMQSIQGDVYSFPAEIMVPIFLKAVEKEQKILNDKSLKALAEIKSWDLQDRTEAIAPSIFYKWIKQITVNTFGDEIPGEYLDRLARSEVIYPFIIGKKKSPIDFYNDIRTPGVTETKEFIIAKSLNDAVDELEKQLGDDIAGWRWGKLHTITLGHTLGGKYNLGPFESDGGNDSVNVADFGVIAGNFNFNHGPSERMTVEMKPGAVRGENVIVGGQSGDRNSPHYKDLMQLWLTKKTHPMYYYEADVEKATVKKVVLSPAGK